MARVCIVAVDIRSIHNVGSFFRTADGFSADIILIGITPRPKGGFGDDRLPHVINKTHTALHKTALGAENTVSWKYFTNIRDAVEELRTDGFRIVALEQDASSIPLSDMPRNKSLAILVGPEVEGLSPDIIELCDDVYEIPMSGAKESFNVSVSVGIALYQYRYGK